MESTVSVCSIHNERILNLYCSFCEKPVCILCKSNSTHARHVADVKGPDALKKAVGVRRKFLFKLLERKENSVIPKLKLLILTLSEDLAKLHADVDDGKRKFHQYAENHRGVLDLSEKDWLKELRLRAGTFYQLFDEKMAFLRSTLSAKEERLRRLRNAIETLNDADIVLSFRSLRSNLESIHEENWLPTRIYVTLKFDMAPIVSPRITTPQETRDQYCRLEFRHEIDKPVYFSRIFDTKIPVPRKLLEDDANKISICSHDELFVSFSMYILTYPLDNRRKENYSANVRCLQCVTVKDNILDISCDEQGNLFFLNRNAVRCLTVKKKIRKCFRLEENPSCLCTSKSTLEIFIGFHDSGKIVKYTYRGDVIAIFTYPDTKFEYRPKHIDINLNGEIFFSDESSAVTVLDTNGIWKGSISKEVKTSGSCSLIRPYGIACSPQRHVYVVDANSVTNLHIFNEGGEYLQTAIFKHIQGAHVVHIDKTGDLWLGFCDGRLRIYRPFVVTGDFM